MSFYDDAEFAAIKMARIAAQETEDDNPRSKDMHEVVADMFERHGSNGISGLCVALARQYASALTVVASNRQTSVDVVLDDFEQHKLEQIVGEEAI